MTKATKAWRSVALIMPFAIGLAACDTLTGPAASGAPGSARVAVTFQGSAVSPAASATASPARTVQVEGTNGSLELQEIDMVVSKFELKRAEAASCEDGDQEQGAEQDSTDDAPARSPARSSADGQEDACEEFEANPTFVQLPLEGKDSVAVTAPVDPGTYDRLEFAVERAGRHEGDGTDLAAQIQSQVPDWPADASLLVTGTFTPEGGEPTSFRVFFDAEVKMEMALDPPAVIADGQDADFTVHLDPAAWFRDGMGGVRDLAALDFDTTGQVAQLQVEVENGFQKVEHEEHDEHDD